MASDSFKRACTNWGLGRELYTAPFIWIPAKDANVQQKNGKWTTYEKFSVTKMDIVDGKIVALNIASDKTGKIVYSFGYTRNVANEEDGVQEQKPNIEALKSILYKEGIRMETVFELYKIKSEEEITASKYANIIKNLEKIKYKQLERDMKNE